ncbi:MAG: MBL fold metallo-hydrolase [Candidatus Thermoplasmatota archaeon]|nr:MBL fold metallo-hydrolase [Candidatus Thermoplasmatota archaeon]
MDLYVKGKKPILYITIKINKTAVLFDVMEIKLVWFDSMGAKSACTLIKTKDTSILIDPGAAAMQPSYPLPKEKKIFYKKKAMENIINTSKEAEFIVISHYHYDHYSSPLSNKELYEGKELWIKDPNQWINLSQWKRGRKFLEELCFAFNGNLKTKDSEKKIFEDPFDELDIAKNKDFGKYQSRREELLDKWRKNFISLTNHWSTNEWIEEPILENASVYFADGKKMKIGDTTIRFTKPLFHGIEYARTGWVIATIVECNGEKIIHSSDLQGPVIEDYAQWLIDEKPDILILDGPATYLLGYMLNKINMNRIIQNACRISKEGNPGLMIYDHHLLRGKKFRERTEEVWLKNVTTAAEYNREEPLISRL